MNGLPHHHPMFDRANAHVAITGNATRTYPGSGCTATPTVNSRVASAASAGALAGIDSMLQLQQEIRRRDIEQHKHQAGAYSQQQRMQNKSFRANSIQRIVDLQEHQAQRHRDMDILRQQTEINDQAGRAFSGQMPSHKAMGGERKHFLAGASAAYNVGPDTNIGAMVGDLPRLSAQIAEEMAFRERTFQRRLLKDETIKQRQQQQQHQEMLNNQHHHSMMALHGREQRGDQLLSFQQISNADLMRRSSEVKSAQESALLDSLEINKQSVLEHQLMEAQLLRLQRFQGGAGAADGDQRLDLDIFGQARADATVVSSMWGSGSSEHQHSMPDQVNGSIQHRARMMCKPKKKGNKKMMKKRIPKLVHTPKKTPKSKEHKLVHHAVLNGTFGAEVAKKDVSPLQEFVMPDK